MVHQTDFHRFGRAAWLILFAAVVIVLLMPIGFTATRLFLLGSTPILWVGGLVMLRRRKKMFAAVLAAGLAVGVFLLLPGRDYDPDRLGEQYVQSFKHYGWARYVWGGESPLGIDCSGLLRRAFIDGNIRLGIVTLNPRPVRSALDLWLRDCSAKAIRDGYRGMTVRLFKSKGINKLDTDRIKPGDMAVTTDGIHCFAYLGGKSWIQADPDAGRVTITQTPTNNRWLTGPVYIVRWIQLTDADKGESR